VVRLRARSERAMSQSQGQWQPEYFNLSLPTSILAIYSLVRHCELQNFQFPLSSFVRASAFILADSSGGLNFGAAAIQQ